MKFGIKTSEGENFPAFMAMELKEGFLSAVEGRFVEAPIYDEKKHVRAAAEFDKAFGK